MQVGSQDIQRPPVSRALDMSASCHWHGTRCPHLHFPAWRREYWFSLPLREGMDLLIYGLRALGWESSECRLCKNTGICLPTLFAFDLLFWCRTAVWLICYFLLPNHALGMYNISHTVTSYPLPQSPLPTPHTSTGAGRKKLQIEVCPRSGAVVVKVVIFVVHVICRVRPFSKKNS